MENILLMLVHCRKKVTFDTNQVRVLVLLSVYSPTVSKGLCEAALTHSQFFPSRERCLAWVVHTVLDVRTLHVIRCMLAVFDFDAFPKED